MSIKITDAFQYITDRKPLSEKAIASLEVQKQTCLSKIKKTQEKLGRIDWLLQKNQELVIELKQLSEVQEEGAGAESFVSGSKES
jgi:hypothetical protein